MDLSDFNDLSLDNIGEWPVVVKVVTALILCAGIVAAGYYYFIADEYVALEKVTKTEKVLREEFERKQAKAVNLEAYKLQLKEMQESFGAMLRQLPDKTEVAALLVDVSQTGLAAGLEFKLFQPMPEIKQDFYAELPIKIKVVGDYHEFGEFVSGLAALPRIVTVHDVKISKDKDTGKLVMEAMAKTYRYLEEAG
ncbi:type IV pilus inner membrane component PilO [Thiolapillus brandeum]|uniref:Type IV pilus assembly protein PilO n=1 Tax=Thiolapillus brandeum TaxID=1076588 RepID=A0A7U6GGA3_9GAMM|nr:type 4a pilus biogenesis protein PilO [Thiolapillus brandeum]BAO43112.1 type IV pilus assembly protein PilO [Thiolapillus brandeum]